LEAELLPKEVRKRVLSGRVKGIREGGGKELLKTLFKTRHRWLMPVILATPKAEIRFKASPGEIVPETL
jgi:hypothetical protein